MTADPEADTRGEEPLNDEDDEEEVVIVVSEPTPQPADYYAEVAKRREAEEIADWVVPENDALKAEVQRLRAALEWAQQHLRYRPLVGGEADKARSVIAAALDREGPIFVRGSKAWWDEIAAYRAAVDRESGR